jgi:DNA-binding response OmpR family regulator
LRLFCVHTSSTVFELKSAVKLLIVEDNLDILDALNKGFTQKGYVVDSVANGQKGWELSQTNRYDLIILDINLPGKTGLEVLAKFREIDQQTPVIALTARDSLPDKLTGFTEGFDDYVTKPFEFAELLARVQAFIRRSKSNKDLKLKYKDLEVDPIARIVLVSGKEVELTKIEFNILEYLLRNLAAVVETTELIETIWGETSDMLDPPIRSHIKNLRKKISDSDLTIIQTIPGVGYKIG